MGERDLDRFLAFIDAIVAIAITLLVLPLTDIADEVGDGSVADLLVDHQAETYGFLISFAVIARLWLAYHRIVRDLVRQDANGHLQVGSLTQRGAMSVRSPKAVEPLRGPMTGSSPCVRKRSGM